MPPKKTALDLYRLSRNKGLGFLLLAFLLITTGTDLFSQNYNIQTFTTEDGLSHNDVRAMAVDSSGFMWIATWDGLSRYDGYTFKNYFHKTNDSLSLPYFSVLNLKVDGADNLWLITDDSQVAWYDHYSDNFRRINHIRGDLPKSYRNISVDESGYLWLISKDSLIRYDFINHIFDSYDISRYIEEFGILNSNTTPTVSNPEQNSIWFVSDVVCQFEKNDGNGLELINKYKIDAGEYPVFLDFNFSFTHRIWFSPTGRKWIFSNYGSFLLDEDSGIFRKYRGKLPTDEFQGSGFIAWSEINNGLSLFDQKENILYTFPPEECQMIKGIFCQNKNVLWFSNNSFSGSPLGLNRIVLTPGWFKSYDIPVEINDISTVYAVTKDKYERTWVGARGKYPLIRISPEGIVEKIRINGIENIENFGAIRALIEAPDGLWIGFFKDLLLFYDFRTGTFTRHPAEGLNLRMMARDNDGNLLMELPGTEIGVYNPGTRKIEKSYNLDFNSPVYKLLISDNEIIWAGLFHSKIARIDAGTGNAEILTLTEENYNAEDIYEDKNGQIWIALLGGGVCRLNPDSGEKVFYTTSQGLTNNMTYSILGDKAGNIWVSTNTGISRINPQTGMIRSFGLNEGLTINEFNSGAAFRDDGMFFMGGMGGIVSFRPDSINREEIETADQKVILTEIRASGENKPFKRSVAGPDTVLLEKGEDNIHIFFSSSDFVNSDKTNYRYRLSRINTDWVETDSRTRNVNYSNLKPGRYLFELQATGGDGSWTGTKELRIRLKPFYYQTPAFRVSVSSLLILLIAGYIMMRIRQLNRIADQKQNELRLQSLQGQMNPHFIFNSLNSINYFISKNDALSANRYISDFSKLIRSILYNFSSDYIPFEKEAESIGEYLKIEHLRFGDKFDYSISMNPDIPHGQFKVSPGLVQPFIENAIWHGMRGLAERKGTVRIKWELINDRLLCTVEDDGIGRKNAEAMISKIDSKVSRGISIVSERLAIINKLRKSNYQIKITDLYPDMQEAGTKVVIDIPVKRD